MPVSYDCLTLDLNSLKDDSNGKHHFDVKNPSSYEHFHKMHRSLKDCHEFIEHHKNNPQDKKHDGWLETIHEHVLLMWHKCSAMIENVWKELKVELPAEIKTILSHVDLHKIDKDMDKLIDFCNKTIPELEAILSSINEPWAPVAITVLHAVVPFLRVLQNVIRMIIAFHDK